MTNDIDGYPLRIRLLGAFLLHTKLSPSVRFTLLRSWYDVGMTFLQCAFAIATGLILSMIGDVFLKRSLVSSSLLIVGMLFYAVAAVPIARAYRGLDFGSVFIVSEAFTTVLALLAGTLIFGESVTPAKVAALILALVSLYLISQ